MKKTTLLIATIAALSASSLFSAPLVLTNFASTVASDGGWTYTSATSTLSGPQAAAAVLFPDPQPSEFSLLTVGSNSTLRLELTATVTTSPTGGFTISLEDFSGKQISTNFSWAAFGTGVSTPVTVALGSDPGGFNYARVSNWNLNSGGNGNTMNVALTQLRVTAVPEPSTYALLAVGAVGLFLSFRRRKVQA